MATIKFQIQSKSKNAPIYCRFSISRSKILKRKTGFTVDVSIWDPKIGKAKTRSAEGKSLNFHLAKLEDHIFEKFNIAQSKGENITGDWLVSVIDSVFERQANDKNEVNETLQGYTKKFIMRLDDRVRPNGKSGVKKASKTKYNTILNKIRDYDEFKKHEHLVEEVGLEYRSGFINFLTEEAEFKLSKNTVGRYIKTVKTILLDARKNGLKVHPQLDYIQGFTEESFKYTLSFEELNLIRDAKMPSEKLDAARDWLLISCYTGQRVSDFLRMNKDMIESVEGFDFIVLKQEKTEKLVQIPIHKEVKSVLKKRGGDFPPTFAHTPGSNSAVYNLLVKEVCKISGIDRLTEGELRNNETKVTERGRFPKYMLVSSHIGRRSFATNFYGSKEIPTPLLMNITAHSTERQFLEYIGKKPIDYSLQLAKLWTPEKQ